MFTYEFQRVTANHAPGAKTPPAYEAAIHARAAEGWELVQVLVENPAAIPGEYVLIFRRAAQN